MASFKFNVKLKQNKVNKITENAKTALVKTAEALHTDVVQSGVMPFETGTMQNSSTFVDTSGKDKGKVSLVTNTPYARRLYYHPEYNFQTINNAKARGKWLEDYISGDKKDFCKKNFKKFYKEGER